MTKESKGGKEMKKVIEKIDDRDWRLDNQTEYLSEIVAKINEIIDVIKEQPNDPIKT